MGEARRRGTLEERKAAAVERNKKVALHYGLDFLKMTRREIVNIGNNFRFLTKAQREEVLKDDKIVDK